MKTPPCTSSAACDLRLAARPAGSAASRSPPRPPRRARGSRAACVPRRGCACSAARNAACGPFWLTAPRPISTLPKPGLVDERRVERRRRPLGGIDLLHVVHEVEADRARRARVERREDARMAVGRHALGASGSRRPRAQLHHQVAALVHAAVLGRDGGLPDPVLQALRRPRRGASRSRPARRRAGRRPRARTAAATRAARDAAVAPRKSRRVKSGMGGSLDPPALLKSRGAPTDPRRPLRHPRARLRAPLSVRVLPRPEGARGRPTARRSPRSTPALAAMQTSQEVLARREFERVTRARARRARGLGEPRPAAHAPAGDGRRPRRSCAKAARAGAEERRRSSGCWRCWRAARAACPRRSRTGRRAAELDPADLRAPYALALDIERQGGADERRRGPARARGAARPRRRTWRPGWSWRASPAKRGDAAALQKAIAPLRRGVAILAGAGAGAAARSCRRPRADPRAAATRVAFLKNVLLRAPEYRRALAAVSTPRSEVGEPLDALPRPARTRSRGRRRRTRRSPSQVDAARRPARGRGADAGCGSTARARRSLVAAAAARGARCSAACQRRRSRAARRHRAGPYGVVAADFNYDYRTDLLLAGAGGRAAAAPGRRRRASRT